LSVQNFGKVGFFWISGSPYITLTPGPKIEDYCPRSKKDYCPCINCLPEGDAAACTNTSILAERA
jgi:hypothetical protein